MKIDMKGFVIKTYIDTPFSREGPISANVTFQLTGDLGGYDGLKATMNGLITAGELDISITKYVDWSKEYSELMDKIGLFPKRDKECNCQKGLDDFWIQWVCPKHGYKKR